MALTSFQRAICRRLADNRIATGESYVAGGAALNEVLFGNRISLDIDLFHDTEEAVAASFDADRGSLQQQGLIVRVLRERPSYVEAEVRDGDESVRLEWTRDSAFRFFPLLRHEEFGLVLHPFDLATNKVLALVGRLEVRDWVDVIHCSESLQPLGYLAWAASGKDPGFGPGAILNEAARSSHYSHDEIAELAFAGPPPGARDLSQRWRRILDAAHRVIRVLPESHVGTCVLTKSGSPFIGDDEAAKRAVGRDDLIFHRGRLRGALPSLVE